MNPDGLMHPRLATTFLGLCAVFASRCRKPDVSAGDAAPSASVTAMVLASASVDAMVPDAGIGLNLGGTGAPRHLQNPQADGGLGCQRSLSSTPLNAGHKRWLASFEITGVSWSGRRFWLDEDRGGFYYADLEVSFFAGLRLPAKAECTRVLSEAEVAAFERAARDADVCAYPIQSPTPEAPNPGYALDDPRYARWAQGRWSLFLCTDFGVQCSLQRGAEEWSRDPKLKRLLAAIETLAQATCQ